MKIKSWNIALIGLLLPVFFFGCDDMESIHEKYLQGEQIYAGKLDSLFTNSGYKRVEIVGQTKYLGNSNQAVIKWEDKVEVFEIDAPDEETFSMIIDSLEERTYEFEVFTRDPDENLSVFQTVSGRPVGDIFISSQSVRRITDYETIGDHTYVYWADKAESPYVVVTIISYETVDGDVVTQEISPDDNESILQSGWKPLSTGQVKSGVISGDNGIDTVFVDPVDITLPPPPFTLLDKTLHNLVWMPSDLPGTTNDEPNQFLFDKRGWIGDYESYHSGDNTGGTPAHITVDLGVNAVVRQVELGFREGYTGNNPVEFELWGIDDITNAETEGSDENEFIAKGWKKLYSSPVDPKQPGVKVDLAAGQSVRYVRYRCLGTEAGNDLAHQLTEMTFWGQDVQPIPLSEDAILTINHENPGGPDANEGSSKLIDGDLNTKYLIFDYPDKNPLHIQLELAQPEIATRYTLTSGNDAPDRDPKNWTILGSNNGEDWTVLDMINDHIFLERNQTLSFNIQNDTAYKYYVLAVTANNGGSLFQLSEWTLYK